MKRISQAAVRKRIPVVAGLAVLVLLVGGGVAAALELRAGDILINAEGGFSPKVMPKHQNAPITLYGGGKISTVSGALPPIVKTITFEFDRHGSIDTTGLPVCTKGKLIATDVPQARRNCPGAIVGEGFAHAVVVFPEQGPINASSPITLFNGPKLHGQDTLFAHAYLDVGGPTTFIVPIVIERIHNGVYGYRTVAAIPKIAGGYGVPISGHLKIGRRWTYRGKSHSYLSARCETGHLQVRAEFSFTENTLLTGTFVRPCTARG